MNGFSFISRNIAPNSAFDFMIYTEMVNATDYKIRFSTSQDDYLLNFYQVIAVFYCSDVLQNSLRTNIVQNQVGANVVSSLFFNDAAGYTTSYNTYMGITIFHVR